MLKGLLMRESMLWARPVRLATFALLPAGMGLAVLASGSADGMLFACALTALGAAAAAGDSLEIDRGNTMVRALGPGGRIRQVLVKAAMAPMGAALFAAGAMIFFPRTSNPTMLLAVPVFSLAAAFLTVAVKVTLFAR